MNEIFFQTEIYFDIVGERWDITEFWFQANSKTSS